MAGFFCGLVIAVGAVCVFTWLTVLPVIGLLRIFGWLK